jgi:hypothetical protein
MNASSASAAAPVADFRRSIASARSRATSTAASCAASAPKYIAFVSEYTCCIATAGVFTRGSCLTTIGCVKRLPSTVNVTVYVPGETHGVVGPGAELWGIA